MTTQATDKVIEQLRKSNLSLEDRNALLTEILSNINALPLNEVIVIGQGVKIGDRELDPEQVINFKENCVALKSNLAFQIIIEQMRYLSVNMGVYKSVSLDEIYFSKASLWILSEIQVLLDKII